MTTLPANSTFLPVLDDLLSPDFRPANIPGQTPQTPAETPLSASAGRSLAFGESHTGQLTGKVTFQSGIDLGPEFGGRQGQYSLLSNGGDAGRKGSGGERVKFQTDPQPQGDHAAVKIQKWWKSKKGKTKMGNGTVDPRVENAKHSIRHSRTEEHVRFLETEVHRLKSALSTERKLRSLQLEAIRSLWSQVQKVSSVQSSSGDNNIMTQSMPNGLAEKKSHDSNGMMSASFHSASSAGIQPTTQKSTEVTACTCTKEIQNLKESLSGEMFQLRKMIDQLRVEKKDEAQATTSAAVDDSKSCLQKRPLTLNLTGTGSCKESSQQGKEVVSQSKKEITGYADQMATSIIEDLKETDEKD